MAGEAVDDAAVHPDQNIVGALTTRESQERAAHPLDVNGLVGLDRGRDGEDKRGLPINRLAELAGLDRIHAGQLQANLGDLLKIQVGGDVDGGAWHFDDGDTGIRRRRR